MKAVITRRMLVAALMLASASASAARGQATCGPDRPPCDEPHDGPGCLQPQCCELVCEVDVFCCDVVWDETCVEQAGELCGDVRCPDLGGCFEVHDTGGCLDETCCELVRMHDPFCGFGTWDAICVAEAESWCGTTLECPIVPPVEARDEGESCLDRLNDGCGGDALEIAASAIDCGDVVYGKTSTSVPRDVDWYRLPDIRDGPLVIRLETEFPARMLIATGSCEGPVGILDRRPVDPCGTDEWVVDLPEGDFHLIVEAGADGRSLRSGLPCDEIDPDDPPDDDEEPLPRTYGLHYLLELACTAVPCRADLNGDGIVDGVDLGLLFAAWGACPGSCPADLDGDGTVDGQDLGGLFVGWGECP